MMKILVATLLVYALGLLFTAVGSRLAGRCTTWCCALLGLPMWVVGGTVAPFCLALPQLMLAFLAAGMSVTALAVGTALAGAVTLIGGAGNDVFAMSKGYVGNHASGVNTLTIQDFVHGEDKISLTLAKTMTQPGALQQLTVGTSDTLDSLLARATTGGGPTAPHVSSFVFAGNTYLVLDQNAINGFAATDLAIKITGTPALSFSDLAFAVV